MEATGGKMRFHHFHGNETGRDRLILSMPRPGMDGRHVLAEMIFEFPRVDAGELTVLHARLAPPMLASAVAKDASRLRAWASRSSSSRAITSERMARAGSRRPR